MLVNNYNTASEPLSPQQSHLPIYHTVSIRLLQPGHLSGLGNLRCQSLMLISTHLLQPCHPLLGSLRCQSVPQSFAAWPPSLSSLGYQSLVLVSTHLLQPGCPLLGSLGYQSLVLVSTHLLQPGRPLLGSLGYQSLVLVSRLASLSSAVSDASLSLLVSRICCNVLSLLSAARLVCPALAAASICVPFVRPFHQRSESFLV